MGLFNDDMTGLAAAYASMNDGKYLLTNADKVGNTPAWQNRYNDPTIHKRFVVGIDRAKMRLYDCEQKAQEDIIDNTEQTEYDDDKSKFKKTFGDFKF